MPRGRSVGGGQNPVNNIETTVAILQGVSAQAGANVDIEGTVDLTAGAGTTSVTLRIRRGQDSTGPLVGSAVQCNLTASGRDTKTVNASDQLPADVAGQTYVLTAQQNGANANGVLNSAYIGAIW